MMKICVYCSSSEKVNPLYLETASKLGKMIAEKGYTLVYGGANVGAMKRIASKCKEFGGRVVGVIPKVIHEKGLAFEDADELIITENMRERKAMMENLSDAFIVLPGGFGTMEEFFEIFVSKQLGTNRSALIICNINDFYKPLEELFNHFYNEKFANENTSKLYTMVDNLEDAFEYLKTYKPLESFNKWA